jgi:hypothetical protein
MYLDDKQAVELAILEKLGLFSIASDSGISTREYNVIISAGAARH